MKCDLCETEKAEVGGLYPVDSEHSVRLVLCETCSRLIGFPDVPEEIAHKIGKQVNRKDALRALTVILRGAE